MSGRYPNVGPLLLTDAGIPLDRRRRRRRSWPSPRAPTVTIDGGRVLGRRHRGGRRRTPDRRVRSPSASTAAKSTMGAELERFAENTLQLHPGRRAPAHRRARRARRPRPRLPGSSRPDRRAGHRLQGGPRHPPPQRLPGRAEAAPRRCRRRRRRAARDRSEARPDHRRLRLGLREGAAVRRPTRGPRLPRRAGAGRRAPRGPGPRRTRSTARRARARTSRCCSPTRRGASSSSPSVPTTRWSSSSTRAGPAWPAPSWCA